jgi:hypothetical protein
MKKLQYREYTLIIGILFVFISFLFFGRMNEVYTLLLLIGILCSITSFVLILIGKRKFKSKFLWISVVVISAFIEIMIEPFLIKSSYLIFLNNNENELNIINQYIEKCPENLRIKIDSINPPCEQLDSSTKLEIFELMRKTGVRRIEKYNKRIFYELWGMLDARLGIYFNQDKEQIIDKRSVLKNNWYY